jgi:hypothetical protein
VICIVIAVQPLIRNGQDESCRVEPAEITLESTHPSVGITFP